MFISNYSLISFYSLRMWSFFFLLWLHAMQKYFLANHNVLHRTVINVYLSDKNENNWCLWIVTYTAVRFFFGFICIWIGLGANISMSLLVVPPSASTIVLFRHTRGAQGYSVTVYWLNIRKDYMYIIYEYEQPMHPPNIDMYLSISILFFSVHSVLY